MAKVLDAMLRAAVLMVVIAAVCVLGIIFPAPTIVGVVFTYVTWLFYISNY